MNVQASSFRWRPGLFVAFIVGSGFFAATIWLTRLLSILTQLPPLGAQGFIALLLDFGLAFACNAKGWEQLLRPHGLSLSFAIILWINCAHFALGYPIPSFNLAGEPVRIALAGAGMVLVGLALSGVFLGPPPLGQRGLQRFFSGVSPLVPQIFHAAFEKIRQNFSQHRADFLWAALALGLSLNALIPFLLFTSGELLPLRTVVSFLGFSTFFSFWVHSRGIGGCQKSLCREVPNPRSSRWASCEFCPRSKDDYAAGHRPGAFYLGKGGIAFVAREGW